MSTKRRDEADLATDLESHIQVKEKSKTKISQYPSDIVEQLKRAAFIEGEAANTYIKRVTPTNSTSDPKVVTVEVQDSQLVIDVEDVVGIVNLTPNATLQIDPKIGWSEILEMFVEVGEQRRSLKYRGIPIREFLADDIGIEDIFIVVAVNYLNSLDSIFRHGFIRSFNRRRVTALDARGRIDISNSIRNFDIPNGVPKHEFVQKVVEYSIPVNDVIYRAGKELQKLFQLYAGVEDNHNYTRIFSRIERTIQRLEHRGITGESISMADVPEITIDEIPRQRSYYTQALQISKTILSSSIGEPLDQGREELLMEYILGMESLFEEYTALALDTELEGLQKDPMIDGLSDVTIAKESYQLFEDDEVSLSSQPDHVIKSGDDPVVVLDSKYYAEGKNPLKGSWSRSRLLSYGFHLETGNLGMIAPLASPGTYRFAGRDGEMSIISPEADEFSTNRLKTAIRDYLRNHLAEQKENNATSDLKNRFVCHPEAEASHIDEAFEQPALRVENIVSDVREILEYIVKDARLSDEVGIYETKRRMSEYAPFKKYLSDKTEGYDIVIPFFIPSGDEEAKRLAKDSEILEQNPDLEQADEFIRIHCFKMGENNRIEYYSPVPFGLNW